MNTPKCNASFLSVDQAFKCESEDWDFVVPLRVAKELETVAQELREALEALYHAAPDCEEGSIAGKACQKARAILARTGGNRD